MNKLIEYLVSFLCVCVCVCVCVYNYIIFGKEEMFQVTNLPVSLSTDKSNWKELVKVFLFLFFKINLIHLER